MDKVQIKVSEVLDLLKQGKQRKDIAEHYGLSKSDVAKLFQHPELKGRKAHKPVQFELIDDVTEVEEAKTEQEEVQDFGKILVQHQAGQLGGEVGSVNEGQITEEVSEGTTVASEDLTDWSK